MGTPQGPAGLGDVFEVLLEEATIRLDARPADLASFETRRTNGEPPRNAGTVETISSIDDKDWREDAGFRRDDVENDDRPAPDPVEPVARADNDAADADDGGFAVPGPNQSVQPRAAAADDEAPDPAKEPTIRFAEGEHVEAPAPATGDESDPAPEAIAALAALPIQAQPVAASAAALVAAQALGGGEAAFAALARAAIHSNAPAQATPQGQAASSIIPATAGQFGAETGAAKVLVTPAAVVAQPNAALGGGAAVAALAAEAGQAATQNGAQNGAQNTVQNAPASMPNTFSQIVAATAAVSQIQTQPGSRGGLSGALADGTPIATPVTATGPNTNGAANAAQNTAAAVAATPASELPGQGQGTTSPAAGGPGSSNPQNAQTAFAESNNPHAGSSATPGGLSAGAPASAAGVSNRLAQNARTDTAQTLGAPVPGADNPNGAESGQQTGAPRTLGGTNQGANSTVLDNNQNNTPQTARGDGLGQASAAAQTAVQNPISGTAPAAERTLASASVPRAEGAGQTNGTSPTVAGTPGLTQAAASTPLILPAQARPAAATSLPANQVAVHIQRAVTVGQDRIRITLHPAELGQIDIKLSVSNDGAVRAIVSIERPETFELLQRDARGLEKALQDAGLKTDSGSLSFNLKGEDEQDPASGQEAADTGSEETGNDTPGEPELAPEIIAAANGGGAGHTLDLHV